MGNFHITIISVKYLLKFFNVENIRNMKVDVLKLQ